jgi:hypothetical protein
MAIMGFIIIVAGRVFSDSTKMRVRSQNMIKNSEEVGRVSNLIKEDMSQMGVKAWGQSVNNEYAVYNVGKNNPKIYWNATSTPGTGDSSSYALKHNKRANETFRDSIAFRKAAFDEQGRFLGIREIIWKVTNDSLLLRRCATIHKCAASPSNAVCGPIDNDLVVCPEKTSAKDADSVLIAKNITNFNIIPSKPGMAGNTTDTLFGKSTDKFRLLSRTPSTGDIKEITNIDPGTGTETTVSNFAQNNTETGKSHNQLYLSEYLKTDYKDCKKLTFIKDETYAIEFKMPFSILSTAADSQLVLNSTQFVPGRDHLAIGLRTAGVVSPTPPPGAPKDILFYPAQSAEAADLARHIEFSVSQNLEACVAIIMAYYSPTVSTGQFSGAGGKLKFSNFKIFRKADETFNFPKSASDADYGTEAITNLTERIKQKTNAKAFELILEIENKGEKSGTSSSKGKGMVIITPNNGVIPKD